MHISTVAKNPTGRAMAAVRMKRAPSQDEGIAEMTMTTTTTDLLSEVLASDNLRRAWARVKANRGAPGVDGVHIEDFPAWSREHWPALRRQIESGRYEPQPVRRVEIPKRSGGTRALGIPTVMDRVIQQAIAQVLTPLFEPKFSASSYGFRPGRNAHQAIEQVRTHVKEGRRWAVDLDLAKFFDTVNHDLLMSRLARSVPDRRLLALIGRYLRAGVLVGERLEPSEIGTPQGGPLSPLLANVLLDALDSELKRRGHRFARYADDVVILVSTQRSGERVLRSLTHWLARQLRLTVHPVKSRVAPMSECAFLGFTIKAAKIRWTQASLRDFKHRIRKLTGRSWGVSMRHRLEKLAQYMRGWFGYYGISQYWRPIPELDEWIRRRVRMCYWKQWRWPRTKIGHLVDRGIALREAIRHGVSSRSYWRMSRSPVVQQALSNAWLQEQGVLSARELWCKAQGYRS